MSSVRTVRTVLYVTLCSYMKHENVSISLEMLPVTLFYRAHLIEQVLWATYIGICRDHQLPSKVSNCVPVYPLIVPISAEF